MSTSSRSRARECWEMIHRLVFEGEAQGRMMAACAVAGVPPGVVKTLLHLDPDQPTSMRDIATHFGVDASYITSLADDLERAGLAERRPHPTDRRVKTVAITSKGMDIQRRVKEVMGEPPQCLDALTAAEQRTLRDLLAKALAADPRLGGACAPEGELRHAFGPAAPPGSQAEPGGRLRSGSADRAARRS